MRYPKRAGFPQTMPIDGTASPHPREDKQTEYRNTFWRNKGFPFKDGPKPIAHTAATLIFERFNI